jgi:hypothetical protein
VRLQLTQAGLKLHKPVARAVRALALVLLCLLGTGSQLRADAVMRPILGGMTVTAWPAPIGHRQPSGADVAAGGRSHSLDFDILDKSLNEKLQICRGC